MRRWVEHETFGERLAVEFVDAVSELVTRLTLVPPPWPQFLVVDADTITPVEARLLSAIREAGWAGVAIAVGDASKSLQRSLSIDVVLPRTMDCELLRDTLKHLGAQRLPPLRRIAR